MDESQLEFYNITIQPTGSLVFDPSVPINLRVGNIFVYGSLIVGSEDCPYRGRLTITMTGKPESNDFETQLLIFQQFGSDIERIGINVTQMFMNVFDSDTVIYSAHIDTTYKNGMRGNICNLAQLPTHDLKFSLCIIT